MLVCSRSSTGVLRLVYSCHNALYFQSAMLFNIGSAMMYAQGMWVALDTPLLTDS